jgi:hypothetical protein
MTPTNKDRLCVGVTYLCLGLGCLLWGSALWATATRVLAWVRR